MSEKLDAGATFPSLLLQLPDDGRLELPADISTDYAVVLFYRGHW